METCPKIALPRPRMEGRQPPRLAIEAKKLPIRGLMALIALLALILFGVAPLFTLPSFSLQGLSSLSSLNSHISAGTARSEGASG
jgi:hypothetical protein